ncbi:MAG TPA: hypothetical protein DEP84_14460, partial [Chloroflexi bacterium]|nr:hypothetical protein [Chloroflexota bacterium]
PEQVAEVVVMQGVAALDASAGSIAGLSRDGTQLEVVRAVGYPPELLEAYRCFPLAAPMPLTDAVRTGELILLESPAVRAARYPRLDTSSAALSPWRAWASIPLKVEGRTVGAMGLSFVTARDFSADDCDLMLTLGRQCAQALERARLYGEAREAIRARDVFLSLASHELKTPLATLQGHAELLLRRVRGEASGDERLYRSARSIYEQAVRLHRLIDLLLDFSHLQTGQLRIEHKPVDLCTLARRLIEILEPTLKQHRLDLYCPDEPLLVEGDEVRLTEVLQNLINNAIKYSPAGGPVTVRLERQDEQARLIVADQGFGVPAEALGQIFGRFYRAPNVDPQQISGLGLGLAVVKEVVILHGGTIEVESKEGGGSTFTVVLPLLAGAQRGSGNQEDKHREEPPALEPGRE